jgi:hypothetical protein
MAVPTVRGVGTVAAAINAVSPGLPTGWQPGDLHILFVETSNEPLPAMTGWTNVGAGTVQQAGGTITALTIRYRFAVAGDTAPSVPDAGDHQNAGILGIIGADTASPFDVTSYTTENVSDTSVATPGITTLATETLLIGAVATGVDTATGQISGSWTNTSVTGIAARFNNWAIAGNGGGFAVVTGAVSTAGAKNGYTATLLTADFKALFTGAVKPAIIVPTVGKPRSRGPNYRR